MTRLASRGLSLKSKAGRLFGKDEGSAILEFSIALPLLVVFVVGIYDFSGAFNQKQKIEQAAQEGALIASSQPTSDLYVGNRNPDSVQPIVAAVFNSLASSGVLQNPGNCSPTAATVRESNLQWTYNISGCSSFSGDTLQIIVNRGWKPASAGTPMVVGTRITVSYNYHWQFNSAIQLLFPGASSYLPVTELSEIATSSNQS
jgi:Flp pilus assembly protein TadG